MNVLECSSPHTLQTKTICFMLFFFHYSIWLCKSYLGFVVCLLIVSICIEFILWEKISHVNFLTILANPIATSTQKSADKYQLHFPRLQKKNITLKKKLSVHYSSHQSVFKHMQSSLPNIPEKWYLNCIPSL